MMTTILIHAGTSMLICYDFASSVGLHHIGKMFIFKLEKNNFKILKEIFYICDIPSLIVSSNPLQYD